MRTIAILVLLSLLALSFPVPAHARRLLPQAKPATTTRSVSATRGITASVKFRPDRRAILVNFSNLGIASSVSYTLSYTSRGITQGAGGAVTDTSQGSVSRELLFGSCSAGICRYDTGITNARFVVTTTLKNGKKIAKTFRLKV